MGVGGGCGSDGRVLAVLLYVLSAGPRAVRSQNHQLT